LSLLLLFLSLLLDLLVEPLFLLLLEELLASVIFYMPEGVLKSSP
jgi:hypothetical protein